MLRSVASGSPWRGQLAWRSPALRPLPSWPPRMWPADPSPNGRKCLSRGNLCSERGTKESEAYHIWAGNQRVNITHKAHGESYGVDRTQGILSVQYGITEKWAADINLGVTTVGWRSFSPNGKTESTVGMMDPAFGVRYQIFKEGEENAEWLPTLTFRAEAVLPGSYDEDIAFCSGESLGRH